MAELSAKRVVDRQDCDRDVIGSDEWTENTIKSLGF